jgi:zinc transporter
MSDGDGLIHACILDGAGGARDVGWAQIESWTQSDGTLWVHLDHNGERARRWLCNEGGAPPLAAEALLAEETRPHSTAMPGGLLVILRGVNLNPGADPEDMVALRLWFEPKRIITTRHRRLMSAQDLRDALAARRGPATTGEFLVEVAERLIERMGPVLGDIDDHIDDLEDQILDERSGDLRHKLVEMRRGAILLRRYLAPQRDVLSRLQVEPVTWLGDAHRLRLREVTDRVTRYVEDLDAFRERAALMQEELSSRLADQMNRRMYLLSIVAAVFLPLGLLTGLLGINVGGIPLADNPWGFLIVFAMLIIVAAVQLWVFRRRRLL